MDPNTTLAELRKQAENSSETWSYMFEALDRWLMRGGFLPEDWAKAQEADKVAIRAALGRPRPIWREQRPDESDIHVDGQADPK